jgi:hypothetical protein
MPWTGEDTKDVFKKVIGGLIAAALLAMAYAMVESVEWYYSAALAVLLIVLVFLLITRFARSTSSPGDVPTRGAGAPVIREQDSSSSQASSEVLSEPLTSPVPGEDASCAEKAKKKAAKAEYKRRKKEAKTQEKD